MEKGFFGIRKSQSRHDLKRLLNKIYNTSIELKFQYQLKENLHLHFLVDYIVPDEIIQYFEII